VRGVDDAQFVFAPGVGRSGAVLQGSPRVEVFDEQVIIAAWDEIEAVSIGKKSESEREGSDSQADRSEEERAESIGHPGWEAEGRDPWCEESQAEQRGAASSKEADGEQQTDGDDLVEDRDGLEPVHDEGDEVHLGLAGIPGSSDGGEEFARQSTLEDGSGVVVPQGGQTHQSTETRGRDDTEIADLDSDPDENPVQQLIAAVENLKPAGFTAAGALGEDDAFPRALAATFDQADGVLRPVLAVGVHDDQRIAGEMLMDVSGAEGDGALMSEVAFEAQHSDGDADLGWELLVQGERGAVVDQEHLKVDIGFGEGVGEMREQLGCGGRVVIDGREYNHLVGIDLTHVLSESNGRSEVRIAIVCKQWESTTCAEATLHGPHGVPTKWLSIRVCR